MSSKVDQIVDAANELDGELLNARQQAKFFRSELKNVNRALRLRVLEYKELKRKYDEMLRLNDQILNLTYQDGYQQALRDMTAPIRQPVTIDADAA